MAIKEVSLVTAMRRALLFIEVLRDFPLEASKSECALKLLKVEANKLLKLASDIQACKSKEDVAKLDYHYSHSSDALREALRSID